MKQFAVAVVVVVGLVLIGCGSSNNSSSNFINGNWNASLMSGGNSPVFAFGASMTANNDGSLNITNFSFTTSSPCFASETESGSFTFGGNFNGNVNGKFGTTVQSSTPTGNTLTLTGAASGNTITGHMDPDRKLRLHRIGLVYYDQDVDQLLQSYQAFAFRSSGPSEPHENREPDAGSPLTSIDASGRISLFS